MEQNAKTIKKSKMGLIGLILSLTVLISLGLTAIPTIIVCIIGLFKLRQRKLPCVGLLITLISLFSLMIIFITFLPPNWTPIFLNNYKFKRALECEFWLNYDREHLVDVQSQNTFILCKQGALHFKSVPDTYNKDNVVKYAENNGWKYHLSVTLTKEDYNNYDKHFDDTNVAMYVIDILSPSPILLKKDSTILAFETGNIHGMASYIMLSQDESEMVVFYWNPRLPDPAMKFRLHEGFIELNKIQSGQK